MAEFQIDIIKMREVKSIMDRIEFERDALQEAMSLKEDDLRYTMYNRFFKSLMIFYQDLIVLAHIYDRKIHMPFEPIEAFTQQFIRRTLMGTFIDFYCYLEDYVSLTLSSFLRIEEIEQLHPIPATIFVDSNLITLWDDLKVRYPESYAYIKAQKFVPINRKIEKLPLASHERKFIVFAQTLRNGIHSNFFYHGTEKSFHIPQYELDVCFIDGKSFKEMTMENMLSWYSIVFDIFHKLNLANSSYVLDKAWRNK